jgi:UDP-N-acetyl-2-amino-2-deoxyglucuronate dehydrogenase
MSRNIAIIGTGNAAKTHVETYKEIPDINVKWVVSRSIEQAEKFCKKMGVGNATESLDDVLSDHEVQIVDIISLPHLHLDQARQALDAMKDVFIEKPISINFEDARRFYDDYNQSSQGILVIYQYPYSETFQTFGELVCSKRFGALKAYRVTYFSQRSSDYYGTWTSDPTQSGGGVLINSGI